MNNIFNTKKFQKLKKKYKIGLCLSGGGTRGFSYLGAFKAFEEMGLKFDMVAGTSAGSLFGAIYASGLSYQDMRTRTDCMGNSDFRNSKLGFLPSKMDRLQDSLKKILPVSIIEKLKIPFYAVAVDLKTGKEIDFASGDLPTIITGSCAIPGVFYPVKYKNMTLIDGGVSNNIPADVLKDNGCDFVITIDCNSTRGKGTKSTNFFTQFMTSVGIMIVNNSRNGLNLSDVVIRPDLQEFNAMDTEKREEMILEGYRATMRAIPEIVGLLTGKIKKK